MDTWARARREHMCLNAGGAVGSGQYRRGCCAVFGHCCGGARQGEGWWRARRGSARVDEDRGGNRSVLGVRFYVLEGRHRRRYDWDGGGRSFPVLGVGFATSILESVHRYQSDADSCDRSARAQKIRCHLLCVRTSCH